MLSHVMNPVLGLVHSPGCGTCSTFVEAWHPESAGRQAEASTIMVDDLPCW